MDKILNQLQGSTFHLSDIIYDFLSDKYEKHISEPIPEIISEGFHPESFREMIHRHRSQFMTEEYLNSRLLNPTSGTVDHIHSEIAASTAVRRGKQQGYSGYPLELLRCAGHMHDSDRSYPETMIAGEQKARHDPEAYRMYKMLHVKNSALMAKQLAESVNNDGFYFHEGFINDLQYLILRHEIGGVKNHGDTILNASGVEFSIDLDRLTDILTDSDSLSYFETNILTNWEESNKSELVLTNKVHFMYDRMSQDARRELKETKLNSTSHLLGTIETEDPDVNAIRSILLKVCL
ncbi:MAG: hypothetical protein DRP70_04795 [Spirochaetes bacterium]|nr:MAG: hypothetical protein DRP60_01250 [Spirochaetota bacterium]RKX89108.1 MAG: hypothetical protein DRP70_04795 [Spirochaetota bacterium]